MPFLLSLRNMELIDGAKLAKEWLITSAILEELENNVDKGTSKNNYRWHNHLNPKINKSAWTDEEERILFQCHQEYGNKWKSIAAHLRGRTDNDIKNKFYSSMRKKLRKINKMLGVKNSTSQVREIKPKVLSNIINAASSTD